MKAEWWKEAAWLDFPDGTVWIHPQTKIDPEGEGFRLTAHKVPNYSVQMPAEFVQRSGRVDARV